MHRLHHRKVLGKAIRAYRKEASLSQKSLAEGAGLSLNFVGEVERGTMECSFTSMVKIAEGLRVRVSDLVKEV
jgi:transcriptional regulator with XRE-family HTH domain